MIFSLGFRGLRNCPKMTATEIFRLPGAMDADLHFAGLRGDHHIRRALGHYG
jgi:hypothetical protein